MKKIMQSVLTFLLISSSLALPLHAEELHKQPIKVSKDSEEGLPDYTEYYGLPKKQEGEYSFHANKGRNASSNELAYLAIFIEFPDDELKNVHLDDEQTVKNAEILMNTGKGQIQHAYGPTPVTSLKQYIEKYSYQKFSIETKFFPQDASGKTISYVSTKPRTYYIKKSASNPNGYSGGSQQADRERELLTEAIRAVKPQVDASYNSSQLDKNNDGEIDAITFFVEGLSPISETASINWSDLLWSHKADGYFNTQLAGKSVSTYNLINAYDSKSVAGLFSLNRSGNGTIIHEFMHTLGLPDLYRGEYQSSNPVSFFDIMAYSSSYEPRGMSSYLSSDSLQWHDPLPTIKPTSEITIQKPSYTSSSEKVAVKIKSPLNESEYIVAEYYKRMDNLTAGENADSDGIVLYRVNEEVGRGNINGYPGGQDDAIYVYRPNEPQMNSGDGDLKQAVLSQSKNRISFGKGMKEAGSNWDNSTLYYSDGSNSGIKVTVKSETSNSTTLSIEVPKVEGTGTKGDPYIIYNNDDLTLMRGHPNAYFKLLDNIDMKNYPFTSIEEFHGQLDGNGKTITNLTVNGNGFIDYMGPSSLVKNVNFENITIKNTNLSHTGVVAGSCYGKIDNVLVLSGNVSAPKENSTTLGVGGFVGTLGDTGIIENSGTSAAVNAGTNLGGFIGLNQNGTIKKSYANGKVSDTGLTSAGFIAVQYMFEGTFKDAENTYFDKRATGQSKGVATVMKQITDSGKTGNEGIYGVSFSDIVIDLVKDSKVYIQDYLNPGNITSIGLKLQDATLVDFSTTDGVLTGKKAGTTIITAKLLIGTHYMDVTSNLTITGNVNVTSIKLNTTSKTLQVLETYRLFATVYPSNASDSDIVWSSSDDKIVSVDALGNIKGMKNGSATITATNLKSGISATCKVVVETPVSSVTMNITSKTLTIGSTLQLSATVLPAGASDKSIYWSSSRSDIVSVDQNGKIKALKNGTAVITALHKKSGKKVTSTITVQTPVSYLKLNVTSKSLLKNSTYQLTASVYPTTATNKKVTWKSSNTSIATVTSSGKVTAKNYGTATISATASNGKTISCKVTVGYRILYVLNGGKNTNSLSIYRSQAYTFKSPTRKGYTFGGWYTSKYYKTRIYSINSKSYGDKTLYAKWNKITIKKMSTPSLKNTSSKSLRVSYKKNSGVKGYELYYSTSSRFTASTTKKIKTTSLSPTIRNLQKNKRYYVKVRAYRIDSTNAYVYGSFSTYKNIYIR